MLLFLVLICLADSPLEASNTSCVSDPRLCLQISNDRNMTRENITASLNRTNKTSSDSTEEHHPFPVAVWIQLAFTIVLSLVGMGVALYLGCCFRGCSPKLDKKRYSRKELLAQQENTSKIANTPTNISEVTYSANS